MGYLLAPGMMVCLCAKSEAHERENINLLKKMKTRLHPRDTLLADNVNETLLPFPTEKKPTEIYNLEKLCQKSAMKCKS